MPQPKIPHHKRKRPATAQDVKASAAVGNAVFAYYAKHGKFPESPEQLKTAQQ